MSSEYTPEERKSAKRFLDDVEVRLNSRQSALHNRPDWRQEYGPKKAWDDAVDAERTHLGEQWQMLRDMRKQFNVK